MLFLPEPAAEESVEVQFRRPREAPALPWPPPIRALARQVPALQDEPDALLEAIEEEFRWDEVACLFETTRELDRLAAGGRRLVGVSFEDQKAAARADPQGFKASRRWREAIEGLGFLEPMAV